MGKHGGRTVRRWELGEVAVPGPVAVAVELLLEKLVKPGPGDSLKERAQVIAAVPVSLSEPASLSRPMRRQRATTRK